MFPEGQKNLFDWLNNTPNGQVARLRLVLFGVVLADRTHIARRIGNRKIVVRLPAFCPCRPNRQATGLHSRQITDTKRSAS